MLKYDSMTAYFSSPLEAASTSQVPKRPPYDCPQFLTSLVFGNLSDGASGILLQEVSWGIASYLRQ